MSSSPRFTLYPAQPADIPQLAAISARAFARDANTQMKAQGQKPGAFEHGMAAGLRMWIGLPPSRCVVLKAVERHGDGDGDGAGRIAGWVCWGVRGAELALPSADDEEESLVVARGPDQDGQAAAASDPAAEQRQDQEQQQVAAPDADAASRIERFETMTSKHLAAFQKKVMPEGTRCMYIIAAAVDPAAQGRGVGSRLVRWGTEQADRHGVFCWVHASEAGWRMFEGKGFVEVERLTIDLDEWAVGRREGDDGGWGEYTFRYMVRQAGGR